MFRQLQTCRGHTFFSCFSTALDGILIEMVFASHFPLADRKEQQFSSVGRAQLVKYAQQIILYSVPAQAQALTDLTVGPRGRASGRERRRLPRRGPGDSDPL